MLKPIPRTISLQLSENDNLGPITVEVETYERFENSFELRLEQLVEQWKHLAAPNANRIAREKR